MTTDVILNKTEQTYYDISFTEQGDIATDQSLTTAILLSIFEEKRAAEYEVQDSLFRRGWIGNETTPNFEQGSKTWLFEQERVTGTVLSDLGSVVRNALQWLIDDGIAVDIFVQTPFLKNGVVCTNIDFIRSGAQVERLFFELWESTAF